MAVQFRDYYELLGVSRDSTQEDIKRAFRKMARKYHPDVAKDLPDAEAKFKEINEAYEVLSDPEKRKKYDALGANWQHGSDFRPPPGGYGGFGGFPSGEGTHYEYHFDGSTGFSDFFESMFGNRAAGDQFGAFSGFRPGGGARSAASMRGQDVETDLMVKLEEVLHGSERNLRVQRPDAEKPVTIRVTVPKGVKEGQLIRLSGMGQPGVRGGKPGDLFLRVRLERHPIYRVQDADLYRDVEVAPWECVLGASLQVDTLHGRVNLKIPAGTQTGTSMRLRGRGLPSGSGAESMGDLYLTLNVVVPAQIGEEERELWQKLASESGFNPRES